jgi:L-ascorbate metabolism protein UlaG (beta-lactamase superfamily)
MSASLPKGNLLTFLGHSTFHLVTAGGQRILLDPWVINNPRTPTDKKDITVLDSILISHGHGDHIGDAVEIGKATGAQTVTNYETAHWLGKKGIENTVPMNKGGTVNVGGIKVTMVHADHSCGILDGDEMVYGGEASGYIVELESGFRLYHAGDTAVFGDLKLIGEIYKPDVALLPIGDRFVMSPTEAAWATRLLGVTEVIPMHFATFPLLTGTPEAFRSELDRLGVKANVTVLEPGETLGS